MSACGALCTCEARGSCTRLNVAESRRVRIEGAKIMLARYKAEGQTLDGGREPTLEDLLPIGYLTNDALDPIAAAYEHMVRSYARAK